MTHTKGIDLLSQENQDYYNQHDHQFIVRMVPNIMLEEEDGFYQCADKYDQWDNNPCIPVERNEPRGLPRI